MTRAIEAVEARLKAADLPPLGWYDVLLELEKAGEAGLRPFELQARLLLPQYGVSPTLAGIPSRRTTDGDQLFARMDAVLTQGETLTLRLDARRPQARSRSVIPRVRRSPCAWE